jgi:hypothetical protein
MTTTDSQRPEEQSKSTKKQVQVSLHLPPLNTHSVITQPSSISLIPLAQTRPFRLKSPAHLSLTEKCSTTTFLSQLFKKSFGLVDGVAS